MNITFCTDRSLHSVKGDKISGDVILDVIRTLLFFFEDIQALGRYKKFGFSETKYVMVDLMATIQSDIFNKSIRYRK